MEATFPETAATFVGPNLKPRILVPASASDAARFEFYQKVIEEAGGVFEEERVNIVGIRGVKVDSEKGSGIELSQTASAGEFAAYKAAEKKQKASGPKPQHFSGRAEQGGGEKGTGRWDDVVVSLWLERDGDGNVVKHNVKERIGSVDPAGDNTKWGTAHVRDGQYLYKRGHHNTKQKKPHGKAVKKKFAKSETVKVRQSAGNRKKTHYQYDALVLARNVEVWRDKGRGEETPNNDHYPSEVDDARSQENVRAGDDTFKGRKLIATNVHASPEELPSSEGCQVVRLDQDYEEFIAEIDAQNQAESRGHERSVLYTLIDASKIDALAVVTTKDLGE